MTQVVDVAQVLSDRIAARMGSEPIVLVQAPAEYEPLTITLAAMERLHGPHGFAVVTLPVEVSGLAEAIMAGIPAVANVTTLDADEIEQMRRWLDERLVATPSQLVAVLTTDQQLDPLLNYPFALRLGHEDLTATIDEIVTIHPGLATDGGTLQRVAHLSGGVPALLRVQHPFDVGYHAAMVKAGMPWARRLYGRLVQDDLMALQMWIGRVPDETFAELAQRATETRVGAADLRAAFEEPFVTSPGTLHAGLPGGLARALQELAQRRDPVWGQMVRGRLASAAMAATRLRAFDRMFVLTAIGAWEALDELMSTKMHLLAVLSPALRRWLDVVWPRHVPRTLTYLAYARRLLDGSAELGEMPHGTPPNWHDLIYLFRGEAPPTPGTLKAAILCYLVPVGERRSFDLATGREVIVELTDMLAERVQILEAQEDHAGHADDSALLRLMLLVAADTAVFVGLLPQAQASLRRAMRLGQNMNQVLGDYPDLWTAAVGRNSALAAVAAQPRVAAQRRLAYEEAVRRFGVPDRTVVRTLAIADRYPTDAASLAAIEPLRGFDPDRPYASYEAEAEALRSCCCTGWTPAVTGCAAS